MITCGGKNQMSEKQNALKQKECEKSYCVTKIHENKQVLYKSHVKKKKNYM